MIPHTFHGEFASADASALSESNARVALYGPGGSALTLNANDHVVITDICASAASGVSSLVSIYDGTNNTVSAGEILFRVSLDGGANASSVSNQSLKSPIVCQKGTYPKVHATVGQIYVSIHGYIERVGA